jgi:hypothetical protein
VNKYVNYIYLTICEVTLKSIKGTNFISYTTYCKEMAISLKSNNLSSRDRRTLIAIYDKLDPIFSLNTDEAAIFIVQFFELEPTRLREFELAVRSTNELFPVMGDC